jgi:hypothetical protein
LPQIVRYNGMTFDRGMVMFRKQRLQQHDVFSHVVIYYTLTGPPPPPVKVAMRRSPEVERALIAANIEFTCETDSSVRGGASNNSIHAAAGLRCEVRFDPDFVNDSIIVTLRNVDRFEPIVLDFAPAALDTEALDDLVNSCSASPTNFCFALPARLRPLGGRGADAVISLRGRRYRGAVAARDRRCGDLARGARSAACRRLVPDGNRDFLRGHHHPNRSDAAVDDGAVAYDGRWRPWWRRECRWTRR